MKARINYLLIDSLTKSHLSLAWCFNYIHWVYRSIILFLYYSILRFSLLLLGNYIFYFCFIFIKVFCKNIF